ncbi:kinase-like domain-containing protein [Hypoxylon argillaceum]|nr:kinase-like domain-containing protein [Hypoxylon argillaceum]
MSVPEPKAPLPEAITSSQPPPPPVTSAPTPKEPLVLKPWKPCMDDPRILSKQWGCEVRIFDEGIVLKRGDRVTRSEEAALRIVREHTTIPVPEVYWTEYSTVNGLPYGQIFMEHISGSSLDGLWDALEPSSKERLCNQVWGFVEQLRKIPKPLELETLYQCGADGSGSQDVLLRDFKAPPRSPSLPILDDESLRRRINEGYLHCNGGSYREHLPDFLPRSDISVFTHADLAPRNIMVDESFTITGLIDWEFSGWYPDYWEYAKTQVQWARKDWIHWMDKTKPQDWDIVGIHKAKRVLF